MHRRGGRWVAIVTSALVVVLSVPAVAASHADPVDVDHLLARLRDVLPTDERRAIERSLAEPDVILDLDALEELLSQGEWTSQSVARILQQRNDPATAPLLFRLFLRSRIGEVTCEADVFERALRTLQGFPPEQVRAAVVVAGAAELAAAAERSLVRFWLEPLAQGGAPTVVLDEVARQEAERVARRWLEGVLEPGGAGLVGLQVDSGDGADRLVGEIRSVLLAAILRDRPMPEAIVAAEVARQSASGARPPGWAPATKAALLERLAREPSVELSVYRDDPAPGSAADYPVYPVESLDIGAADRDWLIDLGEPGGGVPRSALLLLGLIGLIGLGRVERLRPFVFRLGAIGVGLACVALLEGLFALFGVRPPIEVEPTFDPHRVGGDLFERVEIDGVPHARSAESPFGMRRWVLPITPPDGELRVVTLGESSVHGTQYLEEEVFSAVLERRLQARFPDRSLRVVNGGVGGTVSGAIVQSAEAVIEMEPDLLLLYFGNNDLGAIQGLARYRAWSPRSMAARVAVDRVRLTRLVRFLLPAPTPDELGPDQGFFDAHPPSPTDLALLRELTALHLQTNFETIVRLARRHGIDVLLVVQGMNDAMCPPDREDDVPYPRCYAPRLRAVPVEVGRRMGVPVLDAPAALRADAAQRFGEPLAGERYFYDTCHPTRLGHAVLGEALAPAAERILRARPR